MKKGIIICIILVVISLSFYFCYKIYSFYHYSGELIGVRGTGIYHRDNCKFIRNISNEKLVFFSDKMAAAEAGYRACKTCKPPDNKKELIEVEKRKAEERKREEEERKNKMNTVDGPDYSKVKILGSSFKKNMIMVEVTGTIKNENSENESWGVSCRVQAIFFDKHKKPIFEAVSDNISLVSGQIKSFDIKVINSIAENIESYKLQLVNFSAVPDWLVAP
ncbi:Ada metal-binding domain-containing protein [Caldicellulosiruptor acetigenus]|uniref:Ada DNA repair metal-binding domain-containing protein n=1 Tax=Caldicellulosiruptor acetigenus 6A TaxID=632516 RepID=G2PXB9_9FIRM|nr:Ada metal-binding domain-containing protein [Caldicellulosiruptor acetigenus]AEM74783.1 hypothetical protein Calla_2238 [Caldicellulosiruptor acetigenus 6A]